MQTYTTFNQNNLILLFFNALKMILCVIITNQYSIYFKIKQRVYANKVKLLWMWNYNQNSAIHDDIYEIGILMQ